MMSHDRLEKKLIPLNPVSGDNQKKFSGYPQYRINEDID